MPERAEEESRKDSLARVPLHRMLLFFLYLKRIRRHYAATLFTISAQAARTQSGGKSHSLKACAAPVGGLKRAKRGHFSNIPMCRRAKVPTRRSDRFESAFT